VRWAAAVTFVCATSAVAYAKPSNPAFLGISMQDLPPAGPGNTAGPCMINKITTGSGAYAAGLRQGDLIEKLDGAQAINCDAVLVAVQSHEAGDSLKIDVLRGSRPVTLNASLWSRAEIMRRRLVGQPMLATELHGVGDQRSLDLSSMRGKTQIVGWFDLRHCSGCTGVFAKLADWSRAQADKPGFTPMPLAVTMGSPMDVKVAPIGLDVPLALADSDAYEDIVVADSDRINFIVIDSRGIVQYVAPIVPNGDDTDAAIDELFAAAEQAARRNPK
jgi:hypothetical protein